MANRSAIALTLLLVSTRGADVKEIKQNEMG